ncbi:hypothetical protein JCM18237_22480 [Halorubrum luteum]
MSEDRLSKWTRRGAITAMGAGGGLAILSSAGLTSLSADRATQVEIVDDIDDLDVVENPGNEEGPDAELEVTNKDDTNSTDLNHVEVIDGNGSFEGEGDVDLPKTIDPDGDSVTLEFSVDNDETASVRLDLVGEGPSGIVVEEIADDGTA